MPLMSRIKDWTIPISIGLIIGVIFLFYQNGRAPEPNSRSASVITKTSYADIIEPVLPFAVSILTSRQVNQSKNSLAEDPYFSKFISPESTQQSSLGSGIVINRQGQVVTNAHVIKLADEIIIMTNTGELAQVTRVLVDPETDIAVLETNLKLSKDLPIQTNGEDRVGDLVFTIGNPFGIGQSVSMGVISATGRQQPGLTRLTDFIQTDAAINPGNSGGALINASGQVIGMNTAIFSSTGGSQGIGFAIPFTQVMAVANELSQKGKVTRGYLGIDVTELTPSQVQTLSIGSTGLRVTSVAQDSPAELASIEVGDIILAINNSQLTSRVQAARIISQLMPNKRTTITIWRNGEQRELEATLSTKN